MEKNPRAKRDNMKNRRMKAKRMLSAAHVLIAVVAIIECLILLVFTTYSWIETSSSLVIKNGIHTTTIDNDMPIADALNYHYTIPASGSVTPDADDPDLNANFSFVKYYQLCKTSSPDGATFYFPKSNTTHGNYRLGDTTDYNTSYIYFDVEVENLKSVTQGFYFTSADIFSIDGETSLTSGQQAALLNAMRLSIQTDDDRPSIYARESKTVNAINNTTNGIIAAQSLAFSGYTSSSSSDDKLFTVTSGNSTKVSFRIWLEMNDLFAPGTDFYGQASDSAIMKNLYNTQIKVNFDLNYAETTAVRFYFDDYSFMTTGANKGAHLTTLDPTYIMYFYDGSAGKYYPMCLSSSGSANAPARWVTANSIGTASATIPETAVRSGGSIVSTNGKNNSYFVYASNNRMSSVGGTTAPTGFKYKWKLDGRSAPVFPTGQKYIFNGFSVAKTDATVSTTSIGNGLGDWNKNNSATLLQFKDETTALNGASYNATSAGANTNIISSNPSAGIFAYKAMTNDAGTTISRYNYTNSVAALYLDDDDGYYKCFVPSTWLGNATPNIFYFSSGTYAVTTASHLNSTSSTDTLSNVACTMYWNAAEPNGNVYTALGTISDTPYANISGSTMLAGIGTWYETTPVSFDSELLDTDLAGTNKYKVSFDGTNYYHLVGNDACNTFSAHVPVGYALNFSRTNSSNNTVYWSGGTRNPVNDTVFYATSLTSGTPDYGTGQWHIAVFVDGTFEHLVYDTVVTGYTDSAGNPGHGQLLYSFDGANYYDITGERLDDYRWYVPDAMTSDNETIWYRWIPYNGTIFEYRQDLSDGIYYVVVEGADPSYGL